MLHLNVTRSILPRERVSNVARDIYNTKLESLGVYL